MKKYSELKNIFSQLSFNCEEYNYETNEEIDLPYCAYAKNDYEPTGADGVVYINIINVRLMLIDSDDNKQYQNEIETLFNNNEIYYDKSIDFVEDERVFTIQYDFEVLDG